ncbi:hypothetical protein OHB04_22295 [Streptomyces sp. NBC_01775]|uniref:hypothetical protein n=1 Tax=Streptomyces sp. NBC_01775 TaxID=2975939 RepID=UPI002DD9EE37|nr:hypothetical protein [Streptomyces sp. NBC_01775]WSB78232.1 hypothetical protein OHB04_22295 [Streptomyces sp. NBC_01775]
MPNTNDLRKTLTDPTPLYFAAGVVDKIREEAPQALAAVRGTDPKEVQARVTQQAKETQAKVSEALGGIDTDVKKLREQAQHLALQSVGVAAEYAVKARETYDELAVRGREAVKNWRSETDEAEVTEVTVRREPVKVAEPPADTAPGATASGASAQGATSSGTKAGSKTGSKSATGTSASTSGAKTSASSGSGATSNSASGTGSGSATGGKKSSTARKTTTPRKASPKTES